MENASDVPSARQSAAGSRRRWARLARWGAVTALVLCVASGFLLKDYIRTLQSLRRIPGTNAYVMDYFVDYNIDEILAEGMDVERIENSLMAVFFPDVVLPVALPLKTAYLAEDIEAISPNEHHCSTMTIHSADGRNFFGRNFDYKHDACLILKTHRAGRVRSVAVLDLHYLNLDRDDLDKRSLVRRIPLLFAPYYLQDGMNEHGVAVADLSVDGVKTPHAPSNPDVIHSTAMRLVLDYAKNTDEAIELLGRLNIHFVAETCHLMISDARSRSKVVEFIDGEMKVTDADENWQVCTNHQICGKSEDENDLACQRYQTASAKLAKLGSQIDLDAVMNVMEAVHQDSTMWTTVYDLSSGEFRFVYRQQYEHPYDDCIAITK